MQCDCVELFFKLFDSSLNLEQGFIFLSVHQTCLETEKSQVLSLAASFMCPLTVMCIVNVSSNVTLPAYSLSATLD